MNKAIDWIRGLRFWPRVLTFHAVMVLAGLAFVASTVSWISLTLGSLMLGAAAAATFHSFRPYCYAWSGRKAFGIRLLNGLSVLMIVYLCLWGRFIEYGALVDDAVSWGERISGILLAGMGFIMAGIFLGKGRWEPDPVVLSP